MDPEPGDVNPSEPTEPTGARNRWLQPACQLRFGDRLVETMGLGWWDRTIEVGDRIAVHPTHRPPEGGLTCAGPLGLTHFSIQAFSQDTRLYWVVAHDGEFALLLPADTSRRLLVAPGFDWFGQPIRL